MKVALINPVTKTADRPNHWWQLFGHTIEKPLETDAEVYIVKTGMAIARCQVICHVIISDVYRPKKSFDTNNYLKGALKLDYLKTSLRWFFPPAYFPLMIGLRKKLKTEDYDIVQISELANPSVIAAVMTSKCVLIWQEQDQYSSRWWVRVLQMIYFNTLGRLLAARVLFIPRTNAAKAFLKNFGYKNILNVIPNGIDTALTFHPIDLPEEHLLVVSRIAQDKGLDFLLNVMAMVVKELPQVKLIIKGDGSQRQWFEKMVRHMDLEHNIVINSGFVSPTELNVLYNKALLTIIPTVGGIFPAVAMESLAAGKPVVSRFARGLKDIIIDGQTGFITDRESEMAKRIVRLVKNEDERKKMGKKGLEIIKEYDYDRIAEKFIAVYTKVLKNIR